MQSLFRVLFLGAVFVAGPTANAQTPPSDKPTERPYHPEPRVIVNVLSVKGPHDAARVQHDARFGWKRIVRCYKLHSPHEKAHLNMEFVVSASGSVTRVFDVHSTPANRELEQCLANSLPGLSMPKASANSAANVEMKLSPGDAPRPESN